MKIKITELAGIALDYTVAKLEGYNVGVLTPAEQRERFLNGARPEELEMLEKIAGAFKAKLCIISEDGYKNSMPNEFVTMVPFMSGPARIEYSTSWLQAGPIIERERMLLKPLDDQWRVYTYDQDTWQYGDTPLVAAMRCYVMSELGPEIDVPEELL